MICNRCGRVFSAEDAVTVKESFGEVHPACPGCGADDMVRSAKCDVCGSDFDIDALPNYICIDCLWDAIDYDVALKYMLDNTPDGLELVNFFLVEWFHADPIQRTTPELTAFFTALFCKLAAAERELLRPGWEKMAGFLMACRTHCLPRYPTDFQDGGYDFSDWYVSYRSNKGGSGSCQT